MVPPTLDDFYSQPQGAASVIRTFIGLHLRRIGGWIAVADLVELCTQSGNSSSSVRSALSRIKQKGLLQRESCGGRPGYRLSLPAARMLERGDRRIFSYRQMTADEGWMVVVFSVPSTQRHLRHRIRQQLIWLGCGAMVPGTWIGPGHLVDEAIDVLAQQDLRDFVTVMRTEDPCPPGTLADAVSSWWDFEDLNRRYEAFLTAHCRTGQWWDGSDKQAFTEQLRLVDDWRAIPYLDPGLPPSLTPPGWLGHLGFELFTHLQHLLAAPAARHVGSVLGAEREGVTG